MSQVTAILIVLIGFIIIGIGCMWWWKTSWVPLMRSSEDGEDQTEHNKPDPPL